MCFVKPNNCVPLSVDVSFILHDNNFNNLALFDNKVDTKPI